MKNILLICSNYLSDTDASGICVRNMAKEMLARGYSVSVISESNQTNLSAEEVEGVKVYKIKNALYTRILEKNRKKGGFAKVLLKLFSTLRFLFVFGLYPNISPIRSLQVTKKACQIINSEKIDMVIGLYRPYESICSVIKLKKKYKDKIKAGTYHLDLIQAPSNKSGLIVKYKRFRGAKAIEKEYKLLDLVMLPESAEERYKSREKSVVLDFPLYIKTEPVVYDDLPFESKYINLTFVGTLDENNRNPQYVIKLIEEFNKTADKKIKLHVWGRMADAQTTNIINDSDYVNYHGTVENKYVSYILAKSDLLLNVGNKMTYDMIPSKIFQFFAVERPILNIVRHPNDKSLSYFVKYGVAINAKEFENDVINDAKNMVDFLQKNLDAEFDISDDVFIKSTPAYAVNLIESVWK